MKRTELNVVVLKRLTTSMQSMLDITKPGLYTRQAVLACLKSAKESGLVTLEHRRRGGNTRADDRITWAAITTKGLEWLEQPDTPKQPKGNQTKARDYIPTIVNDAVMSPKANDLLRRAW